ncbi:hypothetical protein AB6O49_24670 [Streptomyces sp. SBR177]
MLLRSDPNDGGSWTQVAVGVVVLAGCVAVSRRWPLLSLAVTVAASLPATLELFTPRTAWPSSSSATSPDGGRSTAGARGGCSARSRRSAWCSPGSPGPRWGRGSPCCSPSRWRSWRRG